MVAGGTLSADGLAATNHGFTDALLIELNTTGALQWHHLYGGTGWEGAADLLQYTEGGYVVLGTTNSTDGDVSGPGQGLDDIWVFRVNDAGSILWQRKLGTHLVDAASSIAETSDGGILFTAHIGSLVEDGDVAPGMGIGGFWLVKLNADGDILWQNRFGGSGWDAPYGMVQTLDGGWILVGVTTSTDGDVSFHYPGDFMDGWVVKVDSTGQLEWQKTLGGTGWDLLHSVIEVGDGGYLISGFTESNDGDVSGNHGGADGWVVKLDAEGSVEWQRTFGGTGNDQFNSVVHTADGGFALAGFTNSTNGDVSYSLGGGDGWVVKLDSLGNLQWDLPLGGSGNDFLRKILQTEDGGFLVAGDSGSNDGHATGNHGGKDIWVVKLGPDPSGISEGAPAFPLAVFPNPGRDLVRLQYDARTTGTAQLEVFNGAGQLALAPMRRTVHPGPQSWEFDASPLAPGTYQLRLSTADGVVCQRLVKLP